MRTDPWPQQIDDLEEVLQHLYVSANEHAIEMSDEIRVVIKCKYVPLEGRVAIIHQILRTGRTIQ